MDVTINIKDFYDTELERQIEFVLHLHEIVSAYDARQVFDSESWWGYFLGNSVINLWLIGESNLDWEVRFECVNKEKEKKLVRNVLVNKLNPGNYSLEDFGYLCFRVYPSGGSRWEVVGSTVPVYGGTQARDPKRFPVEVDEDDLL